MAKKKPAQEVPCVKSLFLDSGAFSQWTLAARYAKENGGDRRAFYDTVAFWQYLDDYVAFVKKYRPYFDLYANVDVIPDPELTWRNQQYLEKKGLHPVPIVHYRTPMSWLRHYIDRGYGLIGFGGLVVRTDVSNRRRWLDEAFSLLCDYPDRKPRVKVHGFGIGLNLTLLRRYPWWSVDSASWEKSGSFGGIIVPCPARSTRNFDFTLDPWQITVSYDSPDRKSAGRHYLSLPAAEKDYIGRWLSHVGVPLGKRSPSGEVLERGVMTCHVQRKIVNLHYFEELAKTIPEWPWSFQPAQTRRTFGFITGGGKP